MKFYIYKRVGGGGGRMSFSPTEEVGGGGHNKFWGSFNTGV